MKFIPEVAKTYNTTFDLYNQVSNSQSKFKYEAKNWLAQYYDKNNEYQQAFELYLDINIRRSNNFQKTNLLLAEHIKNNKDEIGVSKDKEKALKLTKESLDK
ncbi:21091_t:CDS:2 [Racocetra persica]|uniref:21091_t:CDS:1 n=1 Tax=Racocetra persica TaxID=160502 RepID=A0ACA9LVK6_9GLOM|nr:21091_t:CDS:2 [Racocetra persica]